MHVFCSTSNFDLFLNVLNFWARDYPCLVYIVRKITKWDLYIKIQHEDVKKVFLLFILNRRSQDFYMLHTTVTAAVLEQQGGIPEKLCKILK